MNLHWIDWLIVAAMLVLTFGTALSTRRLMRSVADFLAANRCAGRYLLCISEGMAGLGAISVVAFFEKFYEAGFTAAWWEMLLWAVMLLVALSGWVSYRYRETRAMTMAQFFEMRYSKRFRVFAGILAWISGVLNMGIFPAVGANFFIYYMGLPQTVPGLGISTFAAVMIVLLSISLCFVFLGGQIAVMITDFVQGMFTNIVFLIILVVIFWMFDWDGIVATLKTAPEDASRLNPMKASSVEGFTFWYFLIQVFGMCIYTYRAWQGAQAYYVSAKSAHEAKMAGVLGAWRMMVLLLAVMLLPIGAWVTLHHPEQTAIAQEVHQELARIPDEQIQDQMRVPVTLVKMLPVGVTGLLCAVMLAAFISTHDTYLHSWGSIFIQDVILPFRKKPFTPKQHMWLLRFSILFVAVFIFLWSLLFRQTDFILMFFAMTGTIYLGGVGAVIIGGLYWKKGSTTGAWAALSIGAFFGAFGLVMTQVWPSLYPWMETNTPGFLAGLTSVIEGIAHRVPGINWKVGPEGFPFNGQWIWAFAIVFAIASYLACSLFDAYVRKKPDHNMDRLLHRGQYARGDDRDVSIEVPTGLRAIFPSKEFTFWDRVIYWGQFLWTWAWIIVFTVGTIYGLSRVTTEDGWARFWWVYVVLTVIVSAGTTVWFFLGGIHDIRDLYRTLTALKRDHLDIGMVVDGRDLSEEVSEASNTDVAPREDDAGQPPGP